MGFFRGEGFAEDTQMIADLEHRQTSICEMTKAQRGAVIQALADAIGVSNVFEQMGRKGEVVGIDEINSLLILSDWPSADSTPMELAWLSIPLPDSKDLTFNGYSIFWSLTHNGFAVWIGRTPDRPASEKTCLSNDEVANAVAEAYGFFLSPQARRDHRMLETRRCLRTAFTPLLWLLVVPAAMFGVLLATLDAPVRDWRLWDIYTPAFYTAASLTVYATWKLYRSTTVSIALVMVAYAVWAAVLPLKPGSEEAAREYAIIVPLFVSIYVVQFKHRDILLAEMTWREFFNDKFRGMLTMAGTASVVAATVFGAYELLRLAVKEIVENDDVLRAGAMVVVVVALFVFLLKELRRR